MKILIPSRSRSTKLITPYQIPEKFHKNVFIYVASEQKEDYEKSNPKLQIKSVSTMNNLLGKKLELMARDVEDELIMLCDDDFTFFKRPNKHFNSLEKMTEMDWDVLFQLVEVLFTFDENLYGVGVSMRQGNNFLRPDGERIARLNGCIIYRRSLFLDERVIHDRVNPMNDFDVNLQLLRLGYDNILLSQFCYNQGGTNDPGGSSDYRTPETQTASAHKLAELHPGFVNTRIKRNKTGDPLLKERTEVTVYWKKARLSAERNR